MDFGKERRVNFQPYGMVIMIPNPFHVVKQNVR